MATLENVLRHDLRRRRDTSRRVSLLCSILCDVAATSQIAGDVYVAVA
jgi:hypothetical protein